MNEKEINDAFDAEYTKLPQSSFNRKRQIENLGKFNAELTMYEKGWNDALEMAAYRVEHDFVKSFGKDTLSSIAVYIEGMKK